MKLNKKQKEFLSFIQSTTMGVVYTTSPEMDDLAWQLSVKGLVEKKDNKLPFSGGTSYWILTHKGRDLFRRMK